MVSLFLFFKSCWSLFVIYLAVLGLGCSSSLSLSDERELLSSCGSWASHCSGFSCGAWAFRCGGFRSSKFGAYGLRCSAAFGVILDRGSNQCLLLWQADSLPLSHQGRLHSLYLDCRGMAFFPSGLQCHQTTFIMLVYFCQILFLLKIQYSISNTLTLFHF